MVSVVTSLEPVTPETAASDVGSESRTWIDRSVIRDRVVSPSPTVF